ncbi:MAG: ribose 5-phosphate isomerase B [Actinomycetota bacterium]
MKITIGSDHAGYEHKKYLVQLISSWGHKVSDLGGFEGQSIDYPDIAEEVAKTVAGGKAERGILLCGTGIGVSIAANKVKGIRAAVCWSRETAKLARQHNNANILCMGARFLDKETCGQIAEAFLSEPVSSQERHIRRVNKIMNIEERICTGNGQEQ